MGTLFRSEKMQYVRLTIPREAAHDTVRELGYHGKYHFVDLMEHAGSQTDHFLYFKKRVVECSFWEKKMEKFEEEMKNNSIDIPAIDAAPLEIKQADLLVACKAMVDPLEAELNRNMEFLQNEKRTIHHLEEHVHVLTKLKGQLAMVVEDLPAHQETPDVDDFGAPLEMTFMGSHKHGRDDLKKPLMSDTGAYALSSTSSRDVEDVKSSGQHFHNYLTGTIPAASQGLFERMLFRVSRGNAYVRYHSIEEDIHDPQSGEKMQKAVFHVVFVGRTLQTKVEKICDFFRANRYETPDYNEQFDQQVDSINAMIAEKNLVLSQTEELIKKTLNRFAFDGAHSSPIRNWQDALRKERAICDALRMCQAPNNSQIVISEGWIPTEYVNEVRACLDTAVRHSQAQPAFLQELDTRKAPPTFFKTGKFTKVFQGIVDTYGVPRYQEVNPGVFTCITFPFLFGIMYGDMGHAFFLTIAALLMIIYEDALTVKAKNKTLGEIPTMAFNGRYLLFGMGLCGFYAGSIYNDTFSVPINLFGTSWTYTSENVSTYAEWDGHVYPYGVDPLWYGSKNELTFFNSMKMKISVTFGVVQMTFGIVLSLFNHVYFGHGLSIFFEFLPQLLFMMSTFGYMVFLIIFKWTVDWPNLPSKNPPNLIQTMISMFLKPGSVEADKQLYTGQGMIQAVLVLVAVFSVPMMLFVKPCVENQRHKRKLAAQGRLPSKSGGGYAELHDQGNLNSSIVVVDEEHKEHVAAGGHDDDEEEEFDFSEAFIHQSIHTIEFVLGCVSNTASYLRLWALSLAHAELSSVFWSKLIMTYGVEMGFISFAGWGAWAGATFAVLMCMDVLECFLHALRLHWVEFQNKFFHADGYAFTPFNFEGKQDD